LQLADWIDKTGYYPSRLDVTSCLHLLAHKNRNRVI